MYGMVENSTALAIMQVTPPVGFEPIATARAVAALLFSTKVPFLINIGPYGNNGVEKLESGPHIKCDAHEKVGIGNLNNLWSCSDGVQSLGGKGCKI